MAADSAQDPSHAGEEDDTELRAKVHSKIHVATFLAGFVFAALVEVVIGEDKSVLVRLAAVLLTAALGLFVACIYLYDQLTMPSRYWTHTSDARSERRLEKWGSTLRLRVLGREQARRPHADLMSAERVYAHMVATWMMVFTPAVVFAVSGFVVLLFRKEVLLGMIGVAVLVFIALYFWAIRPRLTVD